MKWSRPNGLERIFAVWCLDLIWKLLMNPCWIFWRTKWKSMWLCLFYSWKIGLAIICIADWLPEYRDAGLWRETWRSINRCRSQVISQQAEVIALYSALLDEQKTVCCFFGSPRNETVAKENTISCDWTSRINTCTLVRVTKNI